MRLNIPLRLSERCLFLAVLDILALSAALFLALCLRPDYLQSSATLRRCLSLILSHPHWLFLLVLIWFPVAYAFDAYDPRTSCRLPSMVPPLLKSALITCGLYLLVPYITPALPSSRLPLAAFLFLLPGCLLTLRSLSILLFNRPEFCRRALIVGTGHSARAIADVIKENARNLYEVMGMVDISPGAHKKKLGNPSSVSSEFVFPVSSLQSLIRSQRIQSLILAPPDSLNGRVLQTLLDSLESGVEIIPMAVLYERLTGRVPVEHVNDSWYVAMPLNHPGLSPVNRLLKRSMDIAFSSLGLLFLSMATPFIALAITIDSPGSIFYKQERIGRSGRRFFAYKFRSMVPDAEKKGAVWAKPNDDRVTRIGRLLRKTHLDEFPQFFNILKGEMSVVGPRPERPEFVDELAQEIPFYRIRHATKPGMAGWGLVRQGYGGSKEDTMIKLQYDLYYIKHQSLWLDLVILIKTAIGMVTLRGRA